MDQVMVSVTGHVLGIRMNRPEKKNALTQAMYGALADALAAAEADPAVRVITITGSGEAFTSGNDLQDFLESPATGEDKPVMRFLSALAEARKPLLAAVNGAAVGIGVTMLLHCDLVHAAEGATFQMPFVNLGVVPEAGSSLLLPRLIGYQRAAQLLFFGDRFDARTALELGLVNAVHAPAALAGALAAAAATLAGKPPEALRMTKELLKGGALRAEVCARLEQERVAFEARLASPEAREAMAAFLQRRTAAPY